MKLNRTILRAIIALSMLAALSLGSTAALAQTDPYGGGEPTTAPTLIIDESQPGEEEPEVLGTTETRGQSPTGDGDTAAEAETRASGLLPFTGGDLALFLLIGTTAIAVGAAIWKRTARESI